MDEISSALEAGPLSVCYEWYDTLSGWFDLISLAIIATTFNLPYLLYAPLFFQVISVLYTPVMLRKLNKKSVKELRDKGSPCTVGEALGCVGEALPLLALMIYQNEVPTGLLNAKMILTEGKTCIRGFKIFTAIQNEGARSGDNSEASQNIQKFLGTMALVAVALLALFARLLIGGPMADPQIPTLAFYAYWAFVLNACLFACMAIQKMLCEAAPAAGGVQATDLQGIKTEAYLPDEGGS